MSGATDIGMRTEFARRRKRKQPHTDDELAALVGELHERAGGPLLRLRKASPWRFRYSYWAKLLPDGPNVAYETLRMLERRGYARKLRSGPATQDMDTYLLTGKGLQ
jgi:hypothetical protein